jgi:peptide deformylase
MKTILQIAQLGEPILRQLAQPVIDVTDPIFQQLIDSLIATSLDANGVGIAAPQVSESCRLFIISSHPNPRYPNAPLMEATPMINPQIVDYSQEIVKGWEGCLSVPGLRGLVPRYQTIVVEYLDRYGHLQHQRLTDFVARIFQHELDHLNGIVFLDRVENNQDLYSEEEFQQLIINNG